MSMEAAVFERVQSAWPEVIKPHYETHGIPLAPSGTRATYTVTSSLDGKKHDIFLEDEGELKQAILALQPAKIEFGLRDPQASNKFLHLPLIFKDKRSALQAVRVVLDLFNTPIQHITVWKNRDKEFYVMVDHAPFKDVSVEEARILYDAFTGETFNPATAQRFSYFRTQYEKAIRDTITQWVAMNPAMLEEHLRNNTPLGGMFDHVHAAIHDDARLDQHLDKHPRLRNYLEEHARSVIFSNPITTNIYDRARLVVPGSYLGVAGTIAARAPLKGGNQ